MPPTLRADLFQIGKSHCLDRPAGTYARSVLPRLLIVPERAYVEGLLGVYELNRIEILRDVYVWAYAMSCRRYMALKQVDVDPDPTWMRYDTEINSMVCHVIRGQHLPTQETLRKLAKEQISTRTTP
ncbi:MAG: hypothetical protein FGM33_04620 [Candidatus Kapabacteria bacterium]|nr:hypothetical protein [Candidatus Kapabacteria bacterium]